MIASAYSYIVSEALRPSFRWLGETCLTVLEQGLRADIMDDVQADAKGGFRRIEVLTDPARRRRWSDDEKG